MIITIEIKVLTIIPTRLRLKVVIFKPKGSINSINKNIAGNPTNIKFVNHETTLAVLTLPLTKRMPAIKENMFKLEE